MVTFSNMIYTNGMKKIKLMNKDVKIYTIVDDEDYEMASKYNWRMHRNYVQATKDKTTVRLHRLILGLKPQQQIVDHINGDPLDNRKENLRICTSSQNSMNRRKANLGKSKFKGVCWRYNTINKNWCATIYKNYEQYHLGYFWTQEEAAKAYDEKAKKLFGEFARLNFPEGGVTL